MTAMMTTKEKISSRFEQAFADQGFAKPSVAELKESAGVSLRTLGGVQAIKAAEKIALKLIDGGSDE